MKIRRPDDFHVHLRQGEMLRTVTPLTATHFGRALVMPNTLPPILTGEDAVRYRDEIVEMSTIVDKSFWPLMTVKLTDATTPEIIREAKQAGVIAAKLYPVGVTTNSEDGVSDPLALSHVYEAMQDEGMVLSIHGEKPGAFCLEREFMFLDTLGDIISRHGRLRVVLEHITTRAAVVRVEAWPANVAATITVHHLFTTLDDVVGDKIQPHHFCKPIPKWPSDRDTLRRAAMGGNPKFFLGTDSAPHAIGQKECASGCAGVFTAPVAIPLLASLFLDGEPASRGKSRAAREAEDGKRLARLEAFTSEYGARFYGLSLNEGQIEIVREAWTVPMEYGGVRPFRAGETLDWQVKE